MSELGLGCVKTRRRSIAIEEVIRLKPFVAFRFLSFYTARVKFGSRRSHRRGLLCPHKRTSSVRPVRSEKCHNRTSASINRMRFLVASNDETPLGALQHFRNRWTQTG